MTSVKGFGSTKMHPCIIEDNFVGKSYSDRLSSVVLSPIFQWKFEPDVTYGSSVPEGKQIIPGWTHSLLQDGEFSEFLNLFVPLLDNIQDCLEQRCNFTRLRVALHQNIINSPTYNNPHTDHQDNHYSAIYYLNDSDGDTFFFKEYDDPNFGTVQQRWDKINSITNFTVEKSVTPQKNRIVIFDGHQFHASSHPKESPYRIILNVNFTTETPIF